MKARFAKLMMVAAIAVVAVIGGSKGAWAQSSCPASFVIPSYSPDFSNTSDQPCLTLNGNLSGSANSSYPAFLTTNPTPTVATVLRLTPNVGGWATSAWFNTPQTVSAGFSTTFSFQISGTSAYNADGFAFVVQNSTQPSDFGTAGTGALAYRGCAVGFGEDNTANDAFCAPITGGIPASAAIEFKTYNDGYPASSYSYPNTANSVSIMSNGANANCIDSTCAIAANNSLQVAGTVNTNGTSVTWASGSLFSTSWAAGTTILINGAAYAISSVTSAYSLTVSTSPGTLSGVPYSFGAPVAGTVSTSGNTVTWVSGSYFNPSWDPGTQILINGTAYYITSGSSNNPEITQATTTTTLTVAPTPPTLTGTPYSVGIILDDGNVHTVTITYTLTPTQSVSPNCFSDSNAAEPCLDVILDGVDLYSGGVYFDLSTLGLASGINAWVGFTAGNAGGNDNEDIWSWTFTPQGQSQTGTVTPSAPANYSFNGGCQDNGSGCTGTGQSATISENPGSSLTINNLVLTEIPIISGNGSSALANQAACNAIVQANLNFVDQAPLGQTAECFVYLNGGGPGIDAPVMFAITCPPSGICDTTQNPFFAAPAYYFSWTCSENSPLIAPTCLPVSSPSSFDDFASLTTTTGLPAIGMLQGAGPDPNNPCTPATGANPPPLFQSNQIVSYVLGDTSSKPVKGGTGQLTGCYVVTYNTPGVIPTAAITSSVSANYPQNSSPSANFSCTSISTDPDSILDPNGYPPVGPYLTVNACTATSGLTAGGGAPTNNSCTPISPTLNSCSGSITLDTSEVGPHTLTVQVEDSALNTAQQQATYNVVGPQTIGGTVSGLSGAAGTGLVLLDNGANSTPVTSGSTSFTFSTPIAFGSGYIVTVGSQPNGQTCSVSNGAGTVASTPVTSVVVTCTTNSYVLTTAVSPNGGGTVSPASGNSYSWDTSVPLVATPNAGYVFSSWTASPLPVANTNPTSVTMTANESVTANFACTLTVSPSSINFGTVYLGSITAQEVTLTNACTTPFAINEPLISLVKGEDSAFVIVSICPKSLAAGSHCTIVVAFVAGPFYTPQSANLSISDNAPGNPQIVPMNATVIDPVASLSPSSLSFPTEKVSSHGSNTMTVTLSNPGATPLTINSITITGTNNSQFTLTPTATPCTSPLAQSGGKCTIGVTFAPTTTGTFSATMTVSDNSITGSTQNVSLTGKGD